MKIVGTHPSTCGRTLHRAAMVLCACIGAAHVEGSAQAVSSTAPAHAGSPVEQRLRDELQLVMAALIESGAFGTGDPTQIALDIETPAQSVGNFGVLVDSARDSRNGVRVLGVTPGGSAERLGLRAGDDVLAVNDVSLAAAGGARTLKETLDQLADDARLAFEVRRDGKTLSLEGSASRVRLPAMHLSIGTGTALAANGPVTRESPDPARSGATAGSTAVTGEAGCGRVSDFDVAPRQQQLHSARIMSIDGVSAGPTGSQSFRVSAGRHVLKIAERIESRYLGFNDALRNSGLDSRRYKGLTVDVPADTTVMVAAHLDDARRNEWKDGAYWEPVAWKQMPEACR